MGIHITFKYIKFLSKKRLKMRKNMLIMAIAIVIIVLLFSIVKTTENINNLSQ